MALAGVGPLTRVALTPLVPLTVRLVAGLTFVRLWSDSSVMLTVICSPEFSSVRETLISLLRSASE